MQAQIIKPSPKLLSKMRLTIGIVALINILGGLLIAIPIATESVRGSVIFFTIWSIVVVMLALVGIALTGPYYRSLSYDRVLADRLGVMDSTAITLCRDNALPIRVCSLKRRGNVKRVVLGEHVGTLVTEEG